MERRGKRLVALLGSTIGNFEPKSRTSFLKKIRAMMQDDDRFLIGLDLVKKRERLEAAYNDSAGVTAEFNRNVLNVLNKELGGDFPVDNFEHVAFYDAARARIEMRLRARRSIRVHLRALDLKVDFQANEEMRTELSCKFTRSMVERELAAAGMRMQWWLTDEQGDFALALAVPLAGPPESSDSGLVTPPLTD